MRQEKKWAIISNKIIQFTKAIIENINFFSTYCLPFLEINNIKGAITEQNYRSLFGDISRHYCHKNFKAFWKKIAESMQLGSSAKFIKTNLFLSLRAQPWIIISINILIDQQNVFFPGWLDENKWISKERYKKMVLICVIF